MPAILTEAQCQIVQSGSGFPVEMIDEQTRQVYYLITSAQFERFDFVFGRGEIFPGANAARGVFLD